MCGQWCMWKRSPRKGLLWDAMAMLREIGRRARGEIERLLGSRIYLDLWVKVSKDWRNRPAACTTSAIGLIKGGMVDLDLVNYKCAWAGPPSPH